MVSVSISTAQTFLLFPTRLLAGAHPPSIGPFAHRTRGVSSIRRSRSCIVPLLSRRAPPLASAGARPAAVRIRAKEKNHMPTGLAFARWLTHCVHTSQEAFAAPRQNTACTRPFLSVRAKPLDLVCRASQRQRGKPTKYLLHRPTSRELYLERR